MGKRAIIGRIVLYEVLGFGLMFLFIWADELFDLPHRLFGAIPTPINWRESVFESLLALALGVFAIVLSRKFLARIRHLEGFLIMCAGCKRVRFKGVWTPVDVYVRDNSDADISHGLCPECLDQYCAGWTPPHTNVASEEV